MGEPLELRVGETTGPASFASDLFFRYPLEIYLKSERKPHILERTSFTLRILTSSREWVMILQLDTYFQSPQMRFWEKQVCSC